MDRNRNLVRHPPIDTNMDKIASVPAQKNEHTNRVRCIWRRLEILLLLIRLNKNALCGGGRHWQWMREGYRLNGSDLQLFFFDVICFFCGLVCVFKIFQFQQTTIRFAFYIEFEWNQELSASNCVCVCRGRFRIPLANGVNVNYTYRQFIRLIK